MAVSSFTIQHSGLQLQAYHWPATTQPLNIAIGLVHGLGEHALRYTHVANFFNSLGYDVFGFDHQGHGKSDGAKGTIQSWDSLLGELDNFQTAIEGALDNLAGLVLWGHSMGGLILLDYLCTVKGSSKLKAAVVTSPALQLGFEPNPVLVMLAGLAKALAPNLVKSNDLDVTAISRDPKVVEEYKADPLVHDRLSMRLGADMLAVPKRLQAKPQNFPVPLLLMHGSKDRICHVDGSRKFAAQAKGDVTLNVWEGLFHETHNEPEQLDVLNFVATWLTAKTN